MDNVVNKLKHRRRLGQFAAVAGRQAMNIDLVGPMTKLCLRVQYTHTGGAATAGALFQQNARLLQKVEVIVQGRDTVFNITPALYAARRLYENDGVPMRGMETVLNPGNGLVTNVDLTIPLHFDLVRGRKRDDAALDLRGLTLAQLAVTFGTVADLWTTPSTATITNLVCSVEGEYILNTDPSKDQYITRSIDELLYPITGSSNNFAFDVDARTGLAIRTLPLFFLTGNIGDDALCPVGGANPGWIQLVAGSRQFVNTEAGFLKADVRDEMRIPAAQELVGVDFLDVLYAGALSTSIPTGRLDANLKFILNTTFTAGNSQVVVQRESTRPLKI